MPREIGINREQITFKCTAATVKKIDSYIGQGELTSRNEVIRHALQFFFDHENQPDYKEQFKAWIVSEDGEAFIKGIIRNSQKK